MPQSYTNLLFHCIFSTKDRLPQIDSQLKDRLLPYFGGIARDLDAAALAANAVADHVHLFLSLPATLSIADAMHLIKTNSSKWIHETFAQHRDFA